MIRYWSGENLFLLLCFFFFLRDQKRICFHPALQEWDPVWWVSVAIPYYRNFHHFSFSSYQIYSSSYIYIQCFFPQYMAQQIKTPLFLINAAYDSWQVCSVFIILISTFNCCSNWYSKFKACNGIANSLILGFFIWSFLFRYEIFWHLALLIPMVTGKAASLI